MSMIDPDTGLALVDEDSPPYLSEELVHPDGQLEGLDAVDIYIYKRSSCPLFPKAKELSERLRDIVKRAKEPYAVWDKDRYKDYSGLKINYTGFPPPHEVREEIEQLEAEFKDESRSLGWILREMEEWSRRQKKHDTQSLPSISKDATPISHSRLNKKHLSNEIQGLQIVGPGQALVLGNPMEFISTVSDIAHRESVPSHFAKDLERVKDEDYLLEQARISANAKHGHQYRSDQLGPFIVQEHGFLRINYCKGILEGIKQWAESDDSFRLMKHHDILQESFEEAFEEGGARWDDWVDEFETLWDEILPGYPQFQEKLGKLRSEARQLFEQFSKATTADEKSEANKRGVKLLSDIYKFFYRFCLGVTPASSSMSGNDIPREMPNRVSDGVKEGEIFRYGNSLTDCDAHFIWKDGDKKNGQKFTEKAKRRYIWEYCRKICDQGWKTQKEVNAYVSERLGRDERVTTDDMKSFLSVIARYSDVPLKELSNTYIVFKEGNGMEVKKVP